MAEPPHWSASKQQLAVLLERPAFGVLSDFDGTLSHFSPNPTMASPTPENRTALHELAATGVTIGLISGRSAGDLHARLPHPNFYYIGNHGLDYWAGDTVALVAAAQPWQLALTQLLREVPPFSDPAILVEDKGVTASFHYRASGDPQRAAAQIAEQLAPLCLRYGFHLNQGNQVWEIKPPLALNKGTALATIVADAHLASVLFLGDDTTDLLAMAELRRLRSVDSVNGQPLAGYAVGVLHAQGSPPELLDYCDFVADGPDDVAGLLGWLANQRATSQTTVIQGVKSS